MAAIPFGLDCVGLAAHALALIVGEVPGTMPSGAIQRIALIIDDSGLELAGPRARATFVIRQRASAGTWRSIAARVASTPMLVLARDRAPGHRPMADHRPLGGCPPRWRIDLMATLILTTVGSVLGGPIGAAIGAIAGQA